MTRGQFQGPGGRDRGSSGGARRQVAPKARDRVRRHASGLRKARQFGRLSAAGARSEAIRPCGEQKKQGETGLGAGAPLRSYGRFAIGGLEFCAPEAFHYAEGCAGGVRSAFGREQLIQTPRL